MQRRTMLAAAGITACLLVPPVLSGCSSSSGSASHAVSSLAANPTYSAEVATLENELLASYKKNFSAAHPYASMKTTLHQVFPKGDLSKLITYGVQQLTPSMTASKKARAEWAQKVVTFELTQTAQGVPSGAATPKIPGVTSPAASKSTP